MEIDDERQNALLEKKIQEALLDNMYHTFCTLFLDNASRDDLMSCIDNYLGVISEPSLHQRLISFRSDVEDLLQSKK